VLLGLLACSVLAFVLAALVVVTDLPRVLHLCPYPDDPRSYAREGCGIGAMSNEYATTLDSGLSHYRVPMPADAQGVRFYLDPGAFNGGDMLFLRFGASPAEVASLLAKLDAKPSGRGAESTWEGWRTTEPIPWQFTDSGRYLVYTYQVAVGTSDDPETDGGTVIVDTQADPRVVYLDVGSD